jgi:restriction endonuclease Mrr
MPLGATFALALILVPIAVIAIVVCSYLLRRRTEAVILRRRLRLVDLAAHSPNGFEGLVEAILVRRGYKTLGRSRGAGHADGGVDLRMRMPSGGIALVQCKNWLSWRVNVEPVRALYGVVAKVGADEGIVVTSGMFSRPARQWAATIPAHRTPMRLIDGEQLIRLASTVRKSPPEQRSRLYRMADGLDRYLPFGFLVDWIDAEFQNRPIWVPLLLAFLTGGLLAIARQVWLGILYAALIVILGIGAQAWRQWQGRLLSSVTSVRDLRGARITRGRLQYIVAEACHRQGYFVREFKPDGSDLYCLEARIGRDRTLIQVLPLGSSRVTIEEVQRLEELRAKHNFQDAVLVTAGVFPPDTADYAAASTAVQPLSGSDLVAFLSGVRAKSVVSSVVREERPRNG